jgi:hypothetical protein
VSLISNPHTLQRYLTLTLRISPEGGGGGIGVVKLLSRPMPLFHRRTAMARPATSQMMVDSAGINHHATPEVRPVAIGLGGFGQAASGLLVVIQLRASVGLMRCSRVSSRSARMVASSLDGLMP